MTKHSMMFFNADGGAGAGSFSGGSAASFTEASQSTDTAQHTGSSISSLNESGAAARAVGLADPDGTFTEGWTSRLPEELGEYRNGLAKFKTVADFARSYQGLEQKLG